jgi:hypothetical protein
MLTAVLARIVWMHLAPFLLAIADDLPILRIHFQLLPVILSPALTLAFGLTANLLLRTVLGGTK